MEKMTNKKALMFVKDNFEMPADVAEKIDAMIASLEKKSVSRKSTKVQAENEEFKSVILTVLSDVGMTASDVIKSDSTFDGMSNQKMSALLKQLVDCGKVEKYKDKKTTLFKLVA